MELLFWGLLFSLVIFVILAVVIFNFAWRDRDESGKLKLIAQFFILVFIAIPSSLLWSFWLLWVDPGRIREGTKYWITAIPLFGVSFIITFIILLLWWGLKRVFKNGWLLAVVVPLPFLFLIGPYAVFVLIVTCFVAQCLLRNKRITNKE